MGWRQGKLLFWWELMSQPSEGRIMWKEILRKRALLNLRSRASQWITIKCAILQLNKLRPKTLIGSCRWTNKLETVWRLGKDSHTWQKKKKLFKEPQRGISEALISILAWRSRLIMKRMLNLPWWSTRCQRIERRCCKNRSQRCKKQILNSSLKEAISLLRPSMILIWPH